MREPGPALPILIDAPGERPMPGLGEFLATAAKDFQVAVYCPQSDDMAGRAQLRAVLGRHLLAYFRERYAFGAERRASEVMRRLQLPFGAPDNVVFHVKHTEDPAMPDVPQPHYLRQFFTYQHLPPHLQAASEPFCELAALLDEQLPRNPEKTAALRFLLQAKDCAVRAVLFSGAATGGA